MSQLDSFGRHEALHMASFLMGAIDEQLLSHAQVQANPEWKALAETAFDALFSLYQAIGADHLRA